LIKANRRNEGLKDFMKALLHVSFTPSSFMFALLGVPRRTFARGERIVGVPDVFQPAAPAAVVTAVRAFRGEVFLDAFEAAEA
jgi:hypothetical protein